MRKNLGVIVSAIFFLGVNMNSAAATAQDVGGDPSQGQGEVVENQAGAPEAPEVEENFVASIAKVLMRADEKFSGLLESLENKRAEWQDVERDMDEAIKALKELAARMGPQGEFGKKIDELIQQASEMHAKYADSASPVLVAVAKRYKRNADELKEAKENLTNRYGAVLQKIRFFESKKEELVELSRLKIFEEAVNIVKEGVKGMEDLDEELEKIRLRYEAARKNIPSAAQ